MHLCSFCNASIPETQQTKREDPMGFHVNPGGYSPNDIDFLIHKVKCPNCKEKTYYLIGTKSPYTELGTISIYPRSRAKIFPEYIPSVLRKDYEEAYAILELSPKASATLSRRCLQGMIRDFFSISKSNLYDEINEIEDKVSPDQKSVLHSLRKIGNVGAHLEKDVNLIIDVSSEDAEKLLLVLEYFFNEWYISKHNTEELFADIEEIDKSIHDQRNN